MVIDCITYNGEKELFDLRYSILSPYVDEFIVVEFDKTFSGKDKPYYSMEIYDKYRKIDPRVKVFMLNANDWEKYSALAVSSPTTEYGKGAKHWLREWVQKESIKDCLTHLKDDDIVFIGDCDEIWNPELNWRIADTGPKKLKLWVYTYFLNNLSTEEFYGTIVAYYKDIKNGILNHIRSTNHIKDWYGGWHFTSMKDSLKQKLTDSYTEETYASPQILENLEKNISNNKDFLGRNFKYEINENNWPDYLIKNRDKYKHLLRT